MRKRNQRTLSKQLAALSERQSESWSAHPAYGTYLELLSAGALQSPDRMAFWDEEAGAYRHPDGRIVDG